MRAQVLPLEAILSIRQLQSKDAFAWNSLIVPAQDWLIVPPVWLSEEHIKNVREQMNTGCVGFSYFLEDVCIGNLQKFLAHIQCGDRVLILIDQIPKPHQIEILKQVWQSDTGMHLYVTFKQEQDWPLEEGKKSLPWFLRDRVCDCSTKLFFVTELNQLSLAKKEPVDAVVAPIPIVSKFFARLEELKESWSYMFWCSPHAVFRTMRMSREIFLHTLSVLWFFKVPFEFLYWRSLRLYGDFKQVYYRWMLAQAWRLKMPFIFLYWRAYTVKWQVRVWWGRFVCKSKRLICCALYPVFKCYWFTHYQYRKRVLRDTNI